MLLIVLSTGVIRSQSSAEYLNNFQTIFINSFEKNLFHLSGNPALINVKPEDEVLSIKSSLSNVNGSFKPFSYPGEDRSYSLIATGEKRIDSNQCFSGFFGFSKLERKNWNWFFNRDYHSDNPFLLGDSTYGGSRINGIVLNAAYANRLSENMRVGLSLNYKVDEGLKTVSPRPTSQHRDITVNAGVFYKINQQTDIGLSAGFSDLNEEIDYREDEGALTQETILLKFKGYDFPNIFRKKVETRYSFTNDYNITGMLNYTLSNFRTTFIFHSGFLKNTIKDDALDPQSVGFWKDDYDELKISSHYTTELVNFALAIHYSNQSGWAKFPPTQTLIYERKNTATNFTGGIEHYFNSDNAVGIEAGVTFLSYKENDHYSAVNASASPYELFVRAGGKIHSGLYFTLFPGCEYLKKTLKDSFLSQSSQSSYFSNFRQLDVLYKLTDYSLYKIFLLTEITNVFDGSLFVYSDYTLVKPLSTSSFGKSYRNYFELILDYRININ